MTFDFSYITQIFDDLVSNPSKVFLDLYIAILKFVIDIIGSVTRLLFGNK